MRQDDFNQEGLGQKGVTGNVDPVIANMRQIEEARERDRVRANNARALQSALKYL